MQNSTVVKMLIANALGLTTVTEKATVTDGEEEVTCGVHTHKRPKRVERERALEVRADAKASGIYLDQGACYDEGSHIMLAKIVKRDGGKLLMLTTPALSYGQFNSACEAACKGYKIAVVHVPPEYTHERAMAHFDFAAWQHALRGMHIKREYHKGLANAERVVVERAAYAKFFGLKWPSIMHAAPKDLEAREAKFARNLVEGVKKDDQTLPFWRNAELAGLVRVPKGA